MPNHDESIAIVGAGLGGLTAALALVKYGFDVTVYERAPGLSEVGAGITLWHNALAVLDGLGAGQRIREVGRQTDSGVIALASGRVLVSASPEDAQTLGEASELYTFHRAELQRALYEQLPPERVRFGMECTGYHQEGPDEVFVDFATGERRRATLLIAADGVGSTLAARLPGYAPPRYAGYTCWRAICAAPSNWGGVCGEIWGRGDRFGVVGLTNDRIYWFAVANAPPNQIVTDENRDDSKHALEERFAHYAFEVPAIIEATDPHAIIWRDIVDRPPTRGWCDGRVVLLGDAAHATTPNMGQGAAMAMESAAILARCLKATPTLSDALRGYEAVRFPRVKRITETSWRIGKMAHWHNPLARGLRNLLISSLPRSTQLEQLRALTGYDAMAAELKLPR
jgi:2-polyprenyl-6-methoxyphenol hydroxylase-like FAD-dependent oxidoreductase